MKRAVAYMRVSTNEQAGEDAFGLEAQKAEIIDYCKKNEIKIIDWFVDEGVSGADKHKPALDAIISGAITNPPVEMVVAAKSDRISRKVEYYYAYKIELQKVGIEIVSVTEDFGRDTIFTPLLEAVTAAMAEVERNLITSRTSGGRKVKASKGGYSGGRTPYGYFADKNVKCMIINQEQAEVVRLIFKMKRDGCTFQRIVDELNNRGYTNKSGSKWSISSVQVIINNEPTYRGMYKYGKNSEWVKGVHEPILTTEDL